ncbi:hypothetical protein Dimus_036862, partial [Dionaea muscipula]
MRGGSARRLVARGVPVGRTGTGRRGGWEPEWAGSPFEEHEPAQQRLVPPSFSTPTRFEVLWSGRGAGARGGELADKVGAAHLQPPCEWRMSFSMTPSLLSPRWTPTEWHFWGAAASGLRS